jgi:hypothetical protein
MVIKTRLSTITVGIATIAVLATMGIIGGAGQQRALASIIETELPIDIEFPDLPPDLELLPNVPNCPEGTIPVYISGTGWICFDPFEVVPGPG